MISSLCLLYEWWWCYGRWSKFVGSWYYWFIPLSVLIFVSNFKFLLVICVACRTHSQREVSGMCVFVNKLDGSDHSVKSGGFIWTYRWWFCCYSRWWCYRWWLWASRSFSMVLIRNWSWRPTLSCSFALCWVLREWYFFLFFVFKIVSSFLVLLVWLS